jgi:hypothetical protein
LLALIDNKSGIAQIYFGLGMDAYRASANITGKQVNSPADSEKVNAKKLLKSGKFDSLAR